VDQPLPIPPTPTPADSVGFRFTLLLTGNIDASCEILREVYALAAQEIAQYRSKDRRNAWLIRQIRSRALKWSKENPAQPAADLSFLPSRVGALPEPARSAFALFLCLNENVEELAELLQLPLPAFAQALSTARQTLVPEATFPQNHKLALHRPWGEDCKGVAKAVRAAQASPELAAQAAADQQWHQEIKEIPLPEALPLLNLAEPPKPCLRALICHPAVLAIALALLVLVGSLTYIAMNRMNDFPGKETVEDLVDEAGALDGSEFEPISPTEAGELDDWFVMKGFEDFNVPDQLQKAKAVGCHIMKHEGVPVAHIALDQRNAMFFVFRVADLKVEAEGAKWRIFQEDDWAVAVRTDERNGYIVMFQGDDAEMPAFLQSVGKWAAKRRKKRKNKRDELIL
jgi:hypothetical protein